MLILEMFIMANHLETMTTGALYINYGTSIKCLVAIRNDVYL